MKRSITMAAGVLALGLGCSTALSQGGSPEKQPAAPSGVRGKAQPAGAKATLKVGDAAPALEVSEWVKGESVSGFEKGTVYVVEFWATWCGPCIKGIPHLTKLQRTYKDAVIIGVDGSERPPKAGEPDKRLDTVKAFVKSQGDKMDYRVAFDGEGSAVNAFMRPAGRNTIPSAFIVGGDGKIAWIGNPAEMDDALAKAVKDAKADGTDASSGKPKGKP